MMLDKVKQFVKESFEKSASGKNLDHFERALYWLLQLKPDADECMQIAAYAHDIERAFRDTNTEQTFKDKDMNDLDVLEKHQKEGGRIIKNFLEKEGFEDEKIGRVVRMISKHETGGDEESDCIKDADSISYLEVNAPIHIKNLVPVIGKDKVKRKIDWMYERISSDRARNMAESFYKDAVRLLKEDGE